MDIGLSGLSEFVSKLAHFIFTCAMLLLLWLLLFSSLHNSPFWTSVTAADKAVKKIL